MTALAVTRERARLVFEDAPHDAERLESTPFTSRGVGEALGNLLAMVAALAKCVEEIVAELEAR